MCVLLHNPCTCTLPWGETVADALARHLPDPPEGLADFPCSDMHQLAKAAGAGSFLAMADRELFARTGDRLPPRESLAEDPDPGAPPWVLPAAYALIAAILATVVTLIAVEL